MKKNYILCVLVLLTALVSNAQTRVYSDDFETGYTANADLVGVNNWQVFDNANYPPVVKSINSSGAGANGSDWYGQISTGGNTTIQRVYALTSGQTYEFKLKYRRTVTTNGALRLLIRKASTTTGQVQTANGTSSVFAELTLSITADSSENYGFRIIQTWGTATFEFDDVSIVCTSCPAPTTTYDGSTSTWSNGNPIGTTNTDLDVTIESGLITIPAAAKSSFKSLTLQPGASISLPDDASITTVDGLTLESTSSSFASLDYSDGSTISGPVTYKRYVAQVWPTGTNDLISSPVTLTDADFDTFAATNTNLAASGNARAFAPFNTASGAYENFTVGGANTIQTAVGYRVATTDGSPIEFIGTLGPSAPSIAITAGTESDWNLIGNPFIAYIDASDWLATNGGSLPDGFQAIYGYNGTSNGWKIINSANANDAGNDIAPGQGFFVKSPPTGATINFNASQRINADQDDYIAGKSANENQEVYAKIQLT
ncbi:hypothetical protein, partial [Polaribacter sp.]|uniref:hypothetical protein n=1 Tax=Polaribacter sp. TaxID=1920175 RepID=UPI003F69ED65